MKNPIAHIVLFAFLFNSLGPLPKAKADEFRLPAPGVMVHLSPPLDPPMLKGIKVHPDNPFRFDFILDRGESELSNAQLKDESSKLIKYFLASLTIPDKDLWVNLSPYEKNRIIPNGFGLTEMGRDLLAEDYMLKQITASLIYPEDEIGKRFWRRVYEEAQRKYGTTNIPVNTFNKVWIVPQKAIVYENSRSGTAYVVESKLKVMLEQDYLALSHNVVPAKTRDQDTSTLGSQIIREIVIPELTEEINENENFARLRQVYNSLILATWYKKKIKDSILSQVYADKNKTDGVNTNDPQEKERIYQRYLQAFKKGVYNYIKEDVDPVTQQSIPRKYFSGGVELGFEFVEDLKNDTNLRTDEAFEITHDKASIATQLPGRVFDIKANIASTSQTMLSSDHAMNAYNEQEIAKDKRSPVEIFLSNPIIAEKKFNKRTLLEYQSYFAVLFNYLSFYHSEDIDKVLDEENIENYNFRVYFHDMVNFSQYAYTDSPYAADARMFLWKMGEIASDKMIEYDKQTKKLGRRLPLDALIPRDEKNKELYILDVASGVRGIVFMKQYRNDRLVLTDRSYFVEGFLNKAKKSFGIGNNLIIRRIDVRNVDQVFQEKQYRFIRLSNLDVYVKDLPDTFLTTMLERIAPGGGFSYEYNNGSRVYHPSLSKLEGMVSREKNWDIKTGTSHEGLTDEDIDYVYFRKKKQPADQLSTEGSILKQGSLRSLSSLKESEFVKAKKEIDVLADQNQNEGTMFSISEQTWSDIVLKDKFSALSQVFFDPSGKVIGFALVYPESPTRGILEKLAVDPQYRASRIPTLLLNSSAQRAKIMGIKSILVAVLKTNLVAQSFYEELGFKNLIQKEHALDRRYNAFAYLISTQELLDSTAAKLDRAMSVSGVNKGDDAYRVQPITPIAKVKQDLKKTPDDKTDTLKLSVEYLTRVLLEELVKHLSSEGFAKTQERFKQEGLEISETVVKKPSQEVYYITNGQIENIKYADLEKQGIVTGKSFYLIGISDADKLNDISKNLVGSILSLDHAMGSELENSLLSKTSDVEVSKEAREFVLGSFKTRDGKENVIHVKEEIYLDNQEKRYKAMFAYTQVGQIVKFENNNFVNMSLSSDEKTWVIDKYNPFSTNDGNKMQYGGSGAADMILEYLIGAVRLSNRVLGEQGWFNFSVKGLFLRMAQNDQLWPINIRIGTKDHKISDVSGKLFDFDLVGNVTIRRSGSDIMATVLKLKALGANRYRISQIIEDHWREDKLSIGKEIFISPDAKWTDQDGQRLGVVVYTDQPIRFLPGWRDQAMDSLTVKANLQATYVTLTEEEMRKIIFSYLSTQERQPFSKDWVDTKFLGQGANNFVIRYGWSALRIHKNLQGNLPNDLHFFNLLDDLGIGPKVLGYSYIIINGMPHYILEMECVGDGSREREDRILDDQEIHHITDLLDKLISHRIYIRDFKLENIAIGPIHRSGVVIPAQAYIIDVDEAVQFKQPYEPSERDVALQYLNIIKTSDQRFNWAKWKEYDPDNKIIQYLEKKINSYGANDEAMVIPINSVTKEFQKAKASGSNWISRTVGADGRIEVGGYRFFMGRNLKGTSFRLYRLKSDWHQGLNVYLTVKNKLKKVGTFYPLLNEYSLVGIYRQVSNDGRISVERLGYKTKIVLLGKEYENLDVILRPYQKDWKKGYLIYLGKKQIAIYDAAKDKFLLFEEKVKTDNAGRFIYEKNRYSLGANYKNMDLVLKLNKRDLIDSRSVFLGAKEVAVYRADIDAFSLLERSIRTDEKGRFGYETVRYSLGSTYADMDLTLKPFEGIIWESGIRVFEGSNEIRSYPNPTYQSKPTVVEENYLKDKYEQGQDVLDTYLNNFPKGGKLMINKTVDIGAILGVGSSFKSTDWDKEFKESPIGQALEKTGFKYFGETNLAFGAGHIKLTFNYIKDFAQISNTSQVNKKDLGGIDLTPANMHLQTRNTGIGIQFHIDPAQLAQLQNASGFVPVIINIQPLIDLRTFLGA